MWFMSGLVMVCVSYPSWRDEERVAALRPLDSGKLAITPGEALAKAEVQVNRKLIEAVRTSAARPAVRYRVVRFMVVPL